MCTTEELFQRIDGRKRCSTCKEGDLYCATYVGPLYCAAKDKILFIGLDHGKGDCVGLQARQKEMIEWPRRPGKEGKWNPHYRGCVKVASYLLDSACLNDCTSRCALRASSSPSHTTEAGCVFLQFAQGNAVKCVPPNSPTMRFKGYKRIFACLPLMLEELTVLRPDVIVLQGRSNLYWPLCNLASERGVQRKTTANCCVDIMVWPAWQSVIVSLNHPSMGHLKKDWDREIVPALDEARKQLRASPCGHAPADTNYPWSGRSGTL